MTLLANKMDEIAVTDFAVDQLFRILSKVAVTVVQPHLDDDGSIEQS